MYIAVLLPSILALFALYKKKITISGIIAAWIMGIIITYVGGLPTFIALALTFLLTIISDKLKKDSKDETRTIYQILSNVLTATCALIVYYFKSNEIFLVMYYAVIAASLADTLASSIGSLSKGKNINILTFSEMKKGESGAVSSLGLSASFLGGLIIGGIYYFFGGDAVNYLIIIIMSAFGSLIDSIMGAFLQGKYVCSKCKKQVEDRVHCDREAKLVKGFSFMNNDSVNLLSNVLVFIVTYLIKIIN